MQSSNTTDELADEIIPAANLSPAARGYLAALGLPEPDADAKTAGLIWMHALAIGYSPAYLSQNADGIRGDWPRIPLPADKELLLASAALGKQVAALLDSEKSLLGVSVGVIRPELKLIGHINRVSGGVLQLEDLLITAGWGHAGKGGVTMPGHGNRVERDYTAAERQAIEAGGTALGLNPAQAFRCLGETTMDIYLNDSAYWSNIPSNVWNYVIGGYQVIKKLLSYREGKLLGRALSMDEAREVTAMARRLAALRLLEPALDANYATVVSRSYPWPVSA